MDETWDDPDANEAAPSPWSSLLAWPVLLTLGWLLYEVTTEPALAVSVVCIKFGWADYRAAWWLRRHDPHPGRGSASFWLHVASGLWKTAITAFLLVFVLAVAAGLEQKHGWRPPDQAPAGPPPGAIAALLTAAVGFGLLSIATLFAFGLAFHHGVRLWLGPQVHRARRERVWPPGDPYDPGENHAGRLLLTVLLIWSIPLLLLLLMASLAVLGGPRPCMRDPSDLHPLLATGVLMFGIIGGAVGIVIIGEVLMRYTVAASADECWGPAVQPLLEESWDRWNDLGDDQFLET